MPSVTLRIVDADGNPVPNVTVTFSSETVEDPAWIDEITDEDGYTTGHYRERCEGHLIEAFVSGRSVGSTGVMMVPIYTSPRRLNGIGEYSLRSTDFSPQPAAFPCRAGAHSSFVSLSSLPAFVNPIFTRRSAMSDLLVWSTLAVSGTPLAFSFSTRALDTPCPRDPVLTPIYLKETGCF